MTTQLFHVEFGVCQRSRGGHAVKVAAYQACTKLDAGDGRTFDFRRKTGEHVCGTIMLPEGAPNWAFDPGELWRRAEAAERRGDAQTARLVEIAIPRGVPPSQRMDFARAVVEPYVADGMAVQLDLHCTTATDGQEQPHAHALLTMRRFDGNAFSTRKTRGWNQQFQAEKGRAMRAAIAARMNEWLSANGMSERVDHRTNSELGIAAEREPIISRRHFERRRTTGEVSAELHGLLAHRAARKRGRSVRQMTADAEAVADAAAAEIARLEAARGRRTAAIAPANPAERRRRKERLLAHLLRQHYDTRWLPPTVAARLDRVTIDRSAGTATLWLQGGGRIHDSGDQITLAGHWTEAAIAEMAEAVARHGWTSVVVTGSRNFTDRITAALALREPPISVANHKLSSTARAHVEAELQRRMEEQKRAGIERQLRAARKATARDRRPEAASTDAADPKTIAPEYRPVSNSFVRPP